MSEAHGGARHVIFFELQRQRGASETADDEATQGEEGKQNTRESFHCLSPTQSYYSPSVWARSQKIALFFASFTAFSCCCLR
jgi:hypothetical protein